MSPTKSEGKGTAESFDLDAALFAAAREADANAKPFRFTFGEQDYYLAPKADVRALAALNGGRLDDGLRMLFGTEQYQRLQDTAAVFDEDGLKLLLERYMAFLGTNRGE